MFWSNQPSCSSPSFNSPLFYHHSSPSLMCSCSKVQPVCPWEWGHLLECWQPVGGFWGGKNHIVFTFSFLLTEAPCMGLTVPDCLTDMAFLPQLPVYRKVNRQGLSCRVPEYRLCFHFIMNMENRIKIYCILCIFIHLNNKFLYTQSSTLAWKNRK